MKMGCHVHVSEGSGELKSGLEIESWVWERLVWGCCRIESVLCS